MLIIKEVERNSISYELGIKSGDKLLKFDGNDVLDILDYIFYESQDFFTMTVERKGRVMEFEVEKDDDESLGLEFESDNLDIITCRNNCIFCFIDQMPKGYRNTLYVKDDDYRQSFLCGNYVTLTNVSDKELERIVRLHLSPLYISVHTTNGELRKKMLNNRFADKINDYLKILNDNGIEMHTQVVLVKGVNDGAELESTMKNLSKMENVKTLAVVPCGITEHREGLFPIEDIDKDYSRSVVAQIKSFNKSINRNFVFPADEFYIRGEIEGEDAEFYGDYSQYENGVGMMSLFEEEFNEIAEKRTYKRTFLVITGTSACSFIRKFARKTEELVEGLKIFVEPCNNNLFGRTVTCTGLLSGQDVLKSAKSFTKPFDELVICDVMLKDGENLFLDDYTVRELSKEINKPVRVLPNGGGAFFELLTKSR